jgi:hypothetical protein
MPSEQFSDLIRNANPVTREPTRPIDEATTSWHLMSVNDLHSKACQVLLP